MGQHIWETTDHCFSLSLSLSKFNNKNISLSENCFFFKYRLTGRRGLGVDQCCDEDVTYMFRVSLHSAFLASVGSQCLGLLVTKDRCRTVLTVQQEKTDNEQ